MSLGAKGLARKKIKLSPVEEQAIETPVSSPSASEPGADVSSEPAPVPFSEPEIVDGRRERQAKNRVSIPLTSDGKIDYEACKADMLAKLRSLVADPATAQALGLTPQQAAEIITEEDINQLLDLLGGVEGLIFAKLGNIDADIAAKHAYYTPDQKKLLAKPAQNVIAKHAGSLGWYLRWRDEIALTLLMIALTRAKYQGAKVEMQMRKDGLIPPMAQPQQPQRPAEPQPTNGQEFVSGAETIKPVQ